MDIKIRRQPEAAPKQIILEDLKPGTVFEFDDKGGNPLCIKTEDSYMVLTGSDGSDWFSSGTSGWGWRPIGKIYGKLVGIEVEPI